MSKYSKKLTRQKGLGDNHKFSLKLFTRFYLSLWAPNRTASFAGTGGGDFKKEIINWGVELLKENIGSRITNRMQELLIEQLFEVNRKCGSTVYNDFRLSSISKGP